jgi:hypothetical protein
MRLATACSTCSGFAVSKSRYLTHLVSQKLQKTIEVFPQYLGRLGDELAVRIFEEVCQRLAHVQHLLVALKLSVLYHWTPGKADFLHHELTFLLQVQVELVAVDVEDGVE